MKGRRGRPPKDYGDKKQLVTCVKLTKEDASTLEDLARNSGISVYKYVERMVLDRLEEYRDEYDYDESYISPDDWDDMTDEEKAELGYFM